MRVAIVHDWLIGMRGGERVLEEMLEVYPNATVFTLLHKPGAVTPRIESADIRVSPLGSLPGVTNYYRHLLPWFPRAIQSFDFRGYDVILSSSHCVAKGASAPGVPHVCYCHSPMRYLYDQEAAYSSQFSWTTRRVFKFVQPRLRAWDLKTARRVTHFLANSDHVRRRIEIVYRRTAEVLHPPVAVDRFQPAAQREDFYVTVSALVPYKRVDLLVDAFAKLDRRLIVVGSGPEHARLRARGGTNITFTGWLPDEEVSDLLNRCRGFVFAGVEDFGIAMVEAQAAGAPVIAFASGGALDSVVTTPWMRTGVLFQQQNTQSIVDAVHEAERSEFCIDSFRASAARFRPEWFRKRLRGEVNRIIAGTGTHALV